MDNKIEIYKNTVSDKESNKEMYELLYNEDGMYMYIHTQWGDFTKDQFITIGGRCLQYNHLNRFHIQRLISEVGPDIFRWLFNEGALKSHSCCNRVFVCTRIYDQILNKIIEPRLILEKLCGN